MRGIVAIAGEQPADAAIRVLPSRAAMPKRPID